MSHWYISVNTSTGSNNLTHVHDNGSDNKGFDKNSDGSDSEDGDKDEEGMYGMEMVNQQAPNGDILEQGF